MTQNEKIAWWMECRALCNCEWWIWKRILSHCFNKFNCRVVWSRLYRWMCVVWENNRNQNSAIRGDNVLVHTNQRVIEGRCTASITWNQWISLVDALKRAAVTLYFFNHVQQQELCIFVITTWGKRICVQQTTTLKLNASMAGICCVFVPTAQTTPSSDSELQISSLPHTHTTATINWQKTDALRHQQQLIVTC